MMQDDLDFGGSVFWVVICFQNSPLSCKRHPPFLLARGKNMLDKLNWIDVSIGNCNYWLEKAEDNKDLDSFNYWMAERCRLQRERANLLAVKLGGV